jgi:anti-anti-sigma regulatory factor
MLKILRSIEDESVIFTLIGRIEGEYLAELKRIIGLEARDQNLVLDLKDVVVVDQLAIRFLARCDAESMVLANCPAYIREWLVAEKRRSRCPRP